MAVKVAINGFGRIGRLAFRQMFNAEGYEVLPVIISPERKKQLNQNLMMYFTGFTRQAFHPEGTGYATAHRPALTLVRVQG